MYYFAYGSNLSTRRLQQRVDSAELITTGLLTQHTLIFHKIGRDGSAKCDAFHTGSSSDILYGAVYKIDPEQKANLDDAEGLGNGYEIKQVKVVADDNQAIDAFMYYATRIAESIKPFHWYKQHVLKGASEHCFPQFYVERINNIKSQDDPNHQRTARELCIYHAETV